MRHLMLLPVLLLLTFEPALGAAPPKATTPTAPTAPAAPPSRFGPPPPEVAQAVQKYQAGDVKGAIALLEPMRNKAGAHPAALSLLGTLYYEAGRPGDALSVLGPIADGDIAGPVILQTAGRAALAQGRIDKALEYLKKAVAKAPASPAARDLGILYGSHGDAAESYRYLRPWIQANPDDREARLSAAYDAVELERAPDAQELLKDLPDEPPVRLLRGRVQILKDDPRGAIATLEPLLKAGVPSLEYEARRYLAESYIAIGQSNLVEPLLAGKTGDDPYLVVLLGRAQYQAGDAEKSAATLAPVAQQLAAKEPANAAERALAVGVALEYGRALVGTAKWPEAVASLERATKLDPQNLLAWQVLGQAQAGAGQREEAKKSIEKFRELQSQQKAVSEQVKEVEQGAADPTRRNLDQARALAAQGKGEEALAMVRQEANLAPNDPRPRQAEGEILLSLSRWDEVTALALRELAAGRKEEARQLLQKVLAARPGDAKAAAALKKL